MMKLKRISGIGLAVALIVGLLLPVISQSVFADEGKQRSPRAKQVLEEKFGEGEFRLNQFGKGKTIRDLTPSELDRKNYDNDTWQAILQGDIVVVEQEATFSSIPSVMSDGKTLIPCEWRDGVDPDGVDYFLSDTNLFDATVSGDAVEVEYQGETAYWRPDVFIGDSKAEIIEGPTIVNDPINSNYIANTIQWNYQARVGGWWIFGGRDEQVTRYLRQIEGILQEYYILEENPDADIRIVSNYEASAGFEWLRGIWAADADWKPLELTGDEYEKVVTQEELNRDDLVYPVMIDDTTNYISAYTVGLLKFAAASDTYEVIRNNPVGYVSDGTTVGIGQYWAHGDMGVYRVSTPFLTSDLVDKNIVVATLNLRVGGLSFLDTDFDIVVQSGMPTYPHIPAVGGDYYYDHYAGNGGQLHTSALIPDSYNSITLNATGRGWINQAGWTKFMPRSSRDIASTTPVEWVYESISVWSSAAGTGYAPQLEVLWSEVITAPSVSTEEADSISETTARFVAQVTDDGGEADIGSYQWGETGAYGNFTPEQQGLRSGAWFTHIQTGLPRGQLIYYRAVITNSHSTTYGEQKTFMTYPDVPSNFTTSAGDTEVDLSWTKGDGNQKTLIRYSTVTYPTSITDGTQCYFDTGVSYKHEGLVNGVPVFWTMWSYATEGGKEKYSIAVTGDDVWETNTPYALTTPEVETYYPTEVDQNNAMYEAYLASLGGYGTTTVKFQYYKDGGAPWGLETGTYIYSTPTLFEMPVSGLDSDSLYHVRAWANNTSGTTLGNTVSFTTGAVYAPTILTQPAPDVDMSSAGMVGKVVNDGGDPDGVDGQFEYGIDTTYGGISATEGGLFTDRELRINLEGLDANTTYHYRFVGWNSAGISYGEDVSFTTSSPALPTPQTLTSSGVGSNSALFRAVIIDDGGVASEGSFQWHEEGGSFDDNTTGWQPNKRSGDTFEAFVGGLDIDRTYFVRAQARNATGTGRGEVTSFTTIFGVPRNFVAKAKSSLAIELTWTRGGTMTYIVMNPVAYPTDRDDGNRIYFGAGNQHTISGLEGGKTYYIRAWSWRAGPVFSDEHADALATTLASSAADLPIPQTIDPPPMPSGWFADPNPTKNENMFFYDSVNNMSDSKEIPRGTTWMIIWLTVSGALATWAYFQSKSAMLALIVLMVGVGVMIVREQIPTGIGVILTITMGVMIYLAQRGKM